MRIFADDDTRVKLYKGKNDYVNANYVTVSEHVTSRSLWGSVGQGIPLGSLGGASLPELETLYTLF